MNLVWHWTDWGFESGRVRIGSRRRWRTIGPVTIYFRADSEDAEAWIAALRADNVKAAHPDDGWVDRDENTVHLCYPQFDDGLAVGDRLALGRPGMYRIVHVTGSREAGPITSAAWPAGVPYRWEFRG